MNEIAAALIEIADKLAGRIGGGCGCLDLSTLGQDIGDASGLSQEFRDALRGATPGAFVDSGSNYPDGFTDRAGYLDAKCLVANKVYLDFRESLIGMGGLSALGSVLSFGLLYQLLAGVGTGGAILAGVVAAGVAVPVAMAAAVILIGALIAAGAQFGFACYELAVRLDQADFVCALYNATDYADARNGTNSIIFDRWTATAAEVTIIGADLFEGRLLELVAIMMPDQVLELIFSLASVAAGEFQTPEDPYDCANCGAPVTGPQIGDSLVINPDFVSDISGWTPGAGDTFIWDSGNDGRAKATASGTNYLEQSFQMPAGIDGTMTVIFETQVTGSGTGDGVIFRVWNQLGTLIYNNTITAGSVKTFLINSNNNGWPETPGTWKVATYCSTNKYIEYIRVRIAAA